MRLTKGGTNINLPVLVHIDKKFLTMLAFKCIPPGNISSCISNLQNKLYFCKILFCYCTLCY